MHRILTAPTCFALVTLVAAACGGKVDGSASSQRSASSLFGSGGSSGNGSSGGSSGGGGASAACTQGGGGGGGVAGGACSSVFQTAVCGESTYSVQCTCPSPDCSCLVNGAVVDTVPSTSCSTCGPPDDAWKACGFPAMP